MNKNERQEAREDELLSYELKKDEKFEKRCDGCAPKGIYIGHNIAIAKEKQGAFLEAALYYDLHGSFLSFRL